MGTEVGTLCLLTTSCGGVGVRGRGTGVMGSFAPATAAAEMLALVMADMTRGGVDDVEVDLTTVVVFVGEVRAEESRGELAIKEEVAFSVMSSIFLAFP